MRDGRESEGVFKMAANVKPEKGVVEFHLRSVFWQGPGKTEKLAKLSMSHEGKKTKRKGAG